MPYPGFQSVLPRYVTRHFTRNLALAWALIALSTFNYAFDQQGFNSTQAMNAFTKEFGNYNKKKHAWAIPPYFLSLLNSLVYIGFVVGAWIGSLISSRYGRRMTIFLMSLWAMCAATIIVTSGTSHSRAQMLVGRILNYVYIGMELSTVPVYQSEIAPAAIRGFAVGSYQLSLGLGGVIINSICRGTSEISTNASWEIPYGLYYVVPTIIASLVWLIPESPRWLLMKGRDEEALRALKHFRGEGSEIAAETEIEIMRQSLDKQHDESRWRDLVTGVNLKRTLIVCGLNFFFQATGNFFAGHYGALFVKSLGYLNPFTITVSNSALTTFSAFCGLLLIDRLGRRPLYLAGSAAQGVFLIIMGSLGTPKVITSSLAQGIVAMMLLFQMSYTAAVGPLNYVMTPEIPASRLRDKTVRVGATVNIATIFVSSFTLPYLLDAPYADLGSKVGFIYGGLSFLGFVFGYFCLPELKNRSLEEIDVMFHAGIPLAQFKNYQIPVEDLKMEESDLKTMSVDDIEKK